MTKVTITISQLGVTSVISQKGVTSTISQLGVTSSLSEGGVFGTAPVFVSAVVEDAAPTKVILTYDQDLDESSVPDTTDFTITGKTISAVEVSGATVEVTVTEEFFYGDTITINYTVGSNPIQGDVGGLDADSLVDAPVTNNVADISLIPYVNGFDWPDDNADGIGNGWSKPVGAGTCSIVTGNGFTGNAQRVNHVTGTITQFRYSTGVNAESGATYRITGKFRAGAINWRIYLRTIADLFTDNLGVNTGNATSFSYDKVSTGTTAIIVNIYKTAASADDYLEVDEIRIIKL